jgi:SAM-dependent methyltransferase
MVPPLSEGTPAKRSTTGDALEAAFGRAAPEHFAWQTEAAFVAERERELVRGAFLPLGSKVLDLGCGEGATLIHLDAPEGACGVDLFPDKVRFAQERLPKCHFLTASVYELPFDAGRFDHLLVRDLVHHLEEPDRFVDECRRVLKAGGRIDVLEPCRYNPLIFLHAVTNQAERGELRSTLPFLSRLLSRHFDVVLQDRRQPMPIHRIVFHPTLGWPALAERSGVRALVDGAERLAGRLVPRAMWAYLHVRAIAR